MVTTSLFPISVSIFMFYIYISGYYFLDSTCKWYTVFVFPCLTHFTKHKPPNVKNWLTGKDLDAGKDCRWEKGMTEDEVVGWHHQLDGHELEQALGVGDGWEAWHPAVHEVAKIRTPLSNWTEHSLSSSMFLQMAEFKSFFVWLSKTTVIKIVWYWLKI